jgi:hypothetical protein
MSRITTPFSFHSTASEIIEGINLTGRRAIVTGGASGIGIETARALAGAGASVTLAVRRPEAAQAVAAELRQSTGNDAIDIAALDLADLRSVRAFAESWKGPLHLLVNNAGIMALPERQETPQGFEHAIRCLWSIQDRRCAVGSWHHSPLDHRRHYCKCREPRRDCDRTPEAHRWLEDTRRASQDPTTGCGHVRVTGCITAIERDQRPLFRRLY